MKQILFGESVLFIVWPIQLSSTNSKIFLIKLSSIALQIFIRWTFFILLIFLDSYSNFATAFLRKVQVERVFTFQNIRMLFWRDVHYCSRSTGTTSCTSAQLFLGFLQFWRNNLSNVQWNSFLLLLKMRTTFSFSFHELFEYLKILPSMLK